MPETGKSSVSGAIYALAAFGLVLWLSLIALPYVPHELNVDYSWMFLVAHFFHKGLQAGIDYVFTYGPLSFLVSRVYDSDLVAWRLAWEFAFKGVLALLAVRQIWRQQDTAARVLCALAFLWLATDQSYPDSGYLVAAFLLITLASIALPGMNGFVGEFLILLGSFTGQYDPGRAHIYTAVAASGVILSAVYMLWMFQRVNYGPLTNDKNRGLRDLSLREWFVIAPICASAIVMGVVPNLFLKPMEPAVRKTIEQVRPLSVPRRPVNTELIEPGSQEAGKPGSPESQKALGSQASERRGFQADQREVRR